MRTVPNFLVLPGVQELWVRAAGTNTIDGEKLLGRESLEFWGGKQVWGAQQVVTSDSWENTKGGDYWVFSILKV